MAYTKLFNSIVTSTIWSEDDKTRIVWITMLALADKNGEVQGSIPGLARIAGVPIDDCRAAITKFLSPDPDSRTKDDEGRRIEEIDGGWSLINHFKYREMASKDEMKEAERVRKQRYRARLARNNPLPTPAPQESSNVPDKSPEVPNNPHIADADTDSSQTTPPSPHTLPARTREERPTQQEEHWPDPREYPTLATVEQWAEQVMAPKACAAKWHATRVSENWETRNHRPLQLDSLQPLFCTYATAWKAREAQAMKQTGYPNGNKPRNQALQRDVTAGKTAAQIGDILADH